MLSLKMQRKVLSALADGPKSKTQITDMFKSRGCDYLAEVYSFLDGKAAVSYKNSAFGPDVTVYCIEPEGVRILANIDSLYE